jgi:hypothetical protein
LSSVSSNTTATTLRNIKTQQLHTAETFSDVNDSADGTTHGLLWNSNVCYVFPRDYPALLNVIYPVSSIYVLILSSVSVEAEWTNTLMKRRIKL